MDHVQECLPEEGCGLAGGNAGWIKKVFCIPNDLHSPYRFRLEAKAHLEAFQWMETNGMELVAIFHSHPTGPETPSPSDLREFAYPGVVYLIWSLRSSEWECRGFCIDGMMYREIEIIITEK